jgi:hypothetical protein
VRHDFRSIFARLYDRIAMAIKRRKYAKIINICPQSSVLRDSDLR